jgi:RNA polymerase-interacting CarD/CdnL/TRCF family regulator
MDLKENKRIVHAAHGVGTIKGVATKLIDGRKKVFYTVKTDKLTYWIPANDPNTERIRKVRAPSTFQSALTLIRKKPEKLANNFRSRLKYINEELAKCSLKSNATLIRDLHGRNMEKSLHINESRIFDKLKAQFIKEWSISAGIKIEKAEQKLNDALAESIKKSL